MIATREGNAARFSESRVTVVGRTARGVRGIKLREGDEAVGAVIIENSEEWNDTHRLVTVTAGGYGKRMRADEFDAKGRAIQGVICHNISDKTGPLCSIAAVTEDEDLMLITNTGTLIRTPVDGIPTYSRTAAGVIVMRLSDGAQIVNFAAAPHAEEEEAEEE
jgi:DNA gyrase subunit A